MITRSNWLLDLKECARIVICINEKSYDDTNCYEVRSKSECTKKIVWNDMNDNVCASNF